MRSNVIAFFLENDLIYSHYSCNKLHAMQAIKIGLNVTGVVACILMHEISIFAS